MVIAPDKRRWILLGVMFFAIIFNYVDRQIVSILKPTLKAAYGMADSDYAFIVNTFTICYAIMYPVAGWLVEGWGRSRPRRGPGQSGSVPAAMRCGPPHHAGGPQPHPGQHKVRSMVLQQSRKSQRKCPADGTDELHREPGMAAAAGLLAAQKLREAFNSAHDLQHLAGRADPKVVGLFS